MKPVSHVSANLTQSTIVYHFNIRTLARAIVQLSDLSRDPSLYRFPVDRKSKIPTVHSAMTVDSKRADRTLFLKIGYERLL